MPRKTMLIPTSVPTTHSALDGQVLQIMAASIRVMMASANSHPLPGDGRSWSDMTSSTTPSTKR